MKSALASVAVVSLASASGVAGAPTARLVSSASIPQAATTYLEPSFAATGKPAVLATTFNAGLGAKSSLYVATDFSGASLPMNKVLDDLNWPNYAGQVPKGAIAGAPPGLAVVAGGFLVPTHGNGIVELVDLGSGASPTTRFTVCDTKNFFYHQVMWYDMNGDGLQDMLLARANVPMLPWQKKQQQLLWLEQPKTNANAMSTKWTEHVMVEGGPDVSFDMKVLPGNATSLPQIIAAEFWGHGGRLAIYSCSKALWSDCAASEITATVLDSSEGSFFAVAADDINGDGQVDILATNNRNDGKGVLLAFNYDSASKAWKKNTLMSGIDVTPSSHGKMGKGAPGRALVAKVNTKDEKPSIFLSTDDGGKVILFTPTGTDFTFTNQVLVSTDGTIGFLSVFDVNNDGVAELFVPRYNDGLIEMYTFSAEELIV